MNKADQLVFDAVKAYYAQHRHYPTCIEATDELLAQMTCREVQVFEPTPEPSFPALLTQESFVSSTHASLSSPRVVIPVYAIGDSIYRTLLLQSLLLAGYHDVVEETQRLWTHYQKMRVRAENAGIFVSEGIFTSHPWSKPDMTILRLVCRIYGHEHSISEFMRS